MAVVRVAPVSALRGTVRVPSDKSLTHRALLLSAISGRDVRIERPLDSADTGATLHAVEACGAAADGHLGGTLVIGGLGLRGLRPPPALDCDNAGTLMRLLAGVLVGQAAQHVVLDGDDSLRGRPMTRIARPLRAMGAGVFTAPGGTPPIVVSGGAPLQGIEHRLEVASAQVKSCLLLAGLFAEGETWVLEPSPSRDHTERMLEAAGVAVLREGGAVGLRGPVSSIGLPDLQVPRRLLVGRPAPRRRRPPRRPRGAPARGQPEPEAHGPAGGDAPDGRRRARGAGAARRGRAGRDARGRPLPTPCRRPRSPRRRCRR